MVRVTFFTTARLFKSGGLTPVDMLAYVYSAEATIVEPRALFSCMT